MKKILQLSILALTLLASSLLNAQSPITQTGAINGPSSVSCGMPIEYTFAPGFIYDPPLQVMCNKATWTVIFPDGREENFSGMSIEINAGLTQGTISVFAFASKKDCNISDNVIAATTTDVGITPAPSSLIGPSLLCNSETGSLTASAVPDAIDYTFSVPSGWRINNVLRNTYTTSSTTVSITAPSSGRGTARVSVQANLPGTCGPPEKRTTTIPYGRQIPVINAESTELPTNGFGSFSSTGRELSNFQWIIPSGWGAPGGLNGPSISVITGSTPGNFLVEVTARSCGVTVSNSVNITVTNSSGGGFGRSSLNKEQALNSLETTGESLTIFPNPASNLVNFKAESQLRIQSVEFIDIQGKKVYTRTIDGFDVSLDVSDLPNGTYLANLLMEDGSSEVKRLLINR